MSKRFSVIYKGSKYLGDSYEAIAFRIQRVGNIPYEEALSIAKKSNPHIEPLNSNNIIGKVNNKSKGLSDYINGARALVTIASGETVDQEEINRRAIICSGCPQLLQIPGCMGCGLAGRIATAVKNIKKFFGKSFIIPNNLETKGCGVCSCALSVMLPAKMKQFRQNDQNERPDNCWVKSSSINYHEH